MCVQFNGPVFLKHCENIKPVHDIIKPSSAIRTPSAVPLHGAAFNTPFLMQQQNASSAMQHTAYSAMPHTAFSAMPHTAFSAMPQLCGGHLTQQCGDPPMSFETMLAFINGVNYG